VANGGGRHWNEETQRWEDGTRDAAHVTPPPPARPGHAPSAPPGTVWDPDAPTGEWSVAAPPPAPPGPGHGPRTVWAVVGAAAGVGVAVGLAVTLGLGGGSDDGKNRASTGTPTVASPSFSTQASEDPGTDLGSPSPTAVEPPYGYTAHQDPEGFRIAVPDGWQRSTVASQFGMDVVNFRSAAGDRRIQVYQVAESSPEESFQLYLSDEVPKPPGFRKLALESVDGAGVSGTRLEYVADSLRGEPDIGTWHVYDERFRSVDGRIYAIASYGPDTDGGAGALQDLTTALEWFCPSEGVCPAPTS
jgi:hypothetical protein